MYARFTCMYPLNNCCKFNKITHKNRNMAINQIQSKQQNRTQFLRTDQGFVHGVFLLEIDAIFFIIPIFPNLLQNTHTQRWNKNKNPKPHATFLFAFVFGLRKLFPSIYGFMEDEITSHKSPAAPASCSASGEREW